jgi:hypothetical protein
MEPEIRLKTDDKKLNERISLCVDSELHALWGVCAKHTDVTDKLRDFLREKLPPIYETLKASGKLKQKMG